MKCRLWTPPPITAPGRGDFEDKPLERNDIFCAGHCALPDGKILVAGGAYGVGWYASKLADVFAPTGGTWDPAPFPPPDMEFNRWYPTCTMLGANASGQAHLKVLVTLGRINRDLPDFARDGEIYDPTSPPGSWDAGPVINIGGTYPYIFVLPDGRVYCAGPNAQTRVLDANLGSWVNGETNSVHSENNHGSAVMFEPGKILKVGGSPTGATPATNKVSSIDMTALSPAWQLVTPMQEARRNHNLTLLPDGKVLITGGNLTGTAGPTSGPVFEAELFDPVANTMTTLPAMDSNGARWYHSVAGLLPDGRVVVAGGNGKPTQQIFRPPYLDGSPTRPVIGAAPTSMTYANSYTVTCTPTTMTITKAVLIKLCAVTHSFCQDQRFVPLALGGGTDGTVTVIPPANANIAPPGFSVLLLLNNAGVPSVSVYVRVGP